MCISRRAMRSKDNSYIKEKPKKHIIRVSQEQFDNGDSDFIDERTSKYKAKNKTKSFMICCFM